MKKNVFLLVFTVLFFNACISSNLLRFGELDNDTANKGEIINNFQGNILPIEVSTDTESMSIILPKDDMTIQMKIQVANIEDVLYMNLIDKGEFQINKLIRRVSSLDELDDKQDGWVFEPSVEKGVITLQLYLPSIYLYTSQFNPKVLFSYKRSSRSLQEAIQFNFIRQQYYPTKDDDGHEIGKFGNLEKYCEETGNSVSEEFLGQIEQLNKNRATTETIENLKGLCE